MLAHISQIIKTQRCWLLNFPLAVFCTQNCFWQRRPLTQWPSVWNQSFTPIFFCHSAKGQSGATSETSETSDAEQMSHQWVCLKKKKYCSLHEAVTHMVRKQVLDPLCIVHNLKWRKPSVLSANKGTPMRCSYGPLYFPSTGFGLTVVCHEKLISNHTSPKFFIRFRLRWSTVS